MCPLTSCINSGKVSLVQTSLKWEHIMAAVVVIGSGTIGSELRTQLINAGHEVTAVATSKRITFYRNNERIDSLPTGSTADTVLKLKVNGHIDAVMIAMPNGNKGLDEYGYMYAFADKVIVTCAKAAHAYQYELVRKLGIDIGRRATVGGGTDMLETLRRRQLQRERLTVYAVLNGTLNYIFSQVQQGASFISALRAAQKLGYAEPGNGDPVNILNGELMDICMKASIVYNIALAQNGSVLTPEMFKIAPLQSNDIGALTSRNSRYRFITTFTSTVDYDSVAAGGAGIDPHTEWTVDHFGRFP